jgi:hypothetical protein
MRARKDVDISAICVTHGRTYVLNEAVESFLRLKLPDGITSEMIIVNDCEEQSLHCNIGNVIVKNIKWMEVLAEKVNLAVGMSRGKWLMFFDDDDIHLAHKLIDSFRYIENNPGKYAVKHTHAWIWEYGKITSIEPNLFIGSAMISRDYWDYLGGTRSCEWWDKDIWDKAMANGCGLEITPTPDEIFFVYRWGGIGFHYSGLGGTLKTFKELGNTYRERVKNHPEYRAGDIEIIPGYKQDYEALVKEAINKGIGVKK